MGVLACERKNCENIMCRRFSAAFGYICDDCLEQLIGLGSDVDVAGFMGSEPVLDVGPATVYFHGIFAKVEN